MSYAPTTAEAGWIDASPDPAKAALFVPLAAAFNRLDAGLLDPLLSKTCTYGSQSVLEELAGKRAVVDYLAEKLGALRAAGIDHLVTAELAADPGGRSCSLVRQRSSAYGRPGLGEIAGFHRIARTADGLIGQIFFVTSVPPPAECRGAGLFPGLDDEQVRRAREHQGGRIALGPEITFTLFAMPRVSTCEQMARDLRELVAEFAPARFRVVTPQNREACIEQGISCFPTLLVARNDETVRTLDGYRTNAQVREALADLFQR